MEELTMRLEIALTLRPFILTLALELTKKNLSLSWTAFDAEAHAVERRPIPFPDPDFLRKAGTA
jgi:hypothetical protein